MNCSLSKQNYVFTLSDLTYCTIFPEVFNFEMVHWKSIDSDCTVFLETGLQILTLCLQPLQKINGMLPWWANWHRSGITKGWFLAFLIGHNGKKQCLHLDCSQMWFKLDSSQIQFLRPTTTSSTCHVWCQTAAPMVLSALAHWAKHHIKWSHRRWKPTFADWAVHTEVHLPKWFETLNLLKFLSVCFGKLQFNLIDDYSDIQF